MSRQTVVAEVDDSTGTARTLERATPSTGPGVVVPTLCEGA